MPKKRILVCGTGYGITHVVALQLAAERYELAGLLARGSPNSVATARHFDAPLYRSTAELPGDLDAACVAIGGAAGASIASELLGRGVHVLLEHPVSGADLRRCLAAAAAGGARLHVNYQKADFDAPRAFVDTCRRHASVRPLFVTAVVGRRTVFYALDIIGRALGGLRPFRFEHTAFHAPARAERPAPGRFTLVQASVADTPLTLLLQSVLGSQDDGQDVLVTSRLTFGFANGDLFLGGVGGPVVWTGRDPTDGTAPTWLLERPAAPSHEDLHLLQPVAANERALDRLLEDARSGRCPAFQSEAYLQDLSDLGDLLIANVDFGQELDVRTLAGGGALPPADPAHPERGPFGAR